MKLIVGLGNPGKEYKTTRHNVGFMIIDNYLGKVDWKIKHESNVYQKEINNEQILFAKPLTYMNLSGLSVKKLVNYYKIDIKDILIIQDDLDLEIGKYKLKRNSSSGGHNGIKSIISELQTEEFSRLKVGISKNNQIPIDKYVLSKFTTSELSKITNNYAIYNEIIESFIKKGIEDTMSIYNNQ